MGLLSSGNYDTLFGLLGPVAARMNAWVAYQSTVVSAGDTIITAYAARPDLIDGLRTQVERNAKSMRNWVGNLKQYTDSVLKDLRSQLNAPSSDVTVLLNAIAADMLAQSFSVQANTITLSSVTANTANIGTGKVVLSKLTSDGVDDERIIPEHVTMLCVTSKFNGAVGGSEQFKVTGNVDAGANDRHSLGNGTKTVTAGCGSTQYNIIINSGFEQFTSNAPNNWTISTGVAGTTILKESTILCNEMSTASLKLHNGGGADPLIYQNIYAQVKPNDQLVLGFWVRINGTLNTGSSTLKVYVTGTGFTPVYAHNANPTTLNTTFQFFSAVVNLPGRIPTDLRLVIEWNGMSGATASSEIVIDDLAMIRMQDFGHVRVAIFRGPLDFLPGDSFSWTTTNDYAGHFQTWLGRFYDVALPSSGSPTITDF